MFSFFTRSTFIIPHYESDTPPKDTAKVTTRSTSAIASGKPSKTSANRTDNSNKINSVSNEDSMILLKDFKVEVLSSNKVLTELQATQYQDLKADLTRVSDQMMELKAENARLSKEIDALKEKVTYLENSSPVDLLQSVVSQVIEETFAREKC